ncbi:MAG TPA: DinB family protein [Planctomycetaceae bacterium]|nr:DinB family protein [Planctomycetaceae bacterium]
MFDRELRLNGLMHGLLQKLLADIDEPRLQHPLCEGGNSPAWILAHLAIVNDFCLRNLGEKQPSAPTEWHKRFRPGAVPKDDPAPLPTKAELAEVLESGRRRIVEAAAKADPEKMNQPQTSDFFKDSPVKTVGDVVAHLLTTHFAFHLGQISAWRRIEGKPYLI